MVTKRVRKKIPTAGRPQPRTRRKKTLYTPERCQQVINLMTEGLSKKAAAARIGCTEKTLYRWCDQHAEFALAVKRGEELSYAFWEDIGRHNATGRAKGNMSAWIFNMKNRFGWRDKQEISGDAENPFVVKIVKFGSVKK